MSSKAHQSSNEEDNEAMAALAGGEEEALSQIIGRWKEPITAFLYRAVGNYETAVDLSQEVFVRLYRNRKVYKVGSKFSSYIFMIATNLAKNHFRWKSRHPESELDVKWGANISGTDSSHVDPGDYLEKSEGGEQVWSALQSLPEKLRIPTILYYYQDLSYSEISKVLKCSVKSVETRLYRARNQLKDLLSSE